MKKNKESESFARQVGKRFFVYWIPFALTATLVFFLLFRLEVKSDILMELKDHVEQVRREKTNIQSELRQPMEDTLLLARQDAVKLFFDESIPLEQRLQAVEHEFVSMSATMKIYHQIRLLDSQGKERVRINHEDNDITVVPTEQLAEKIHRYYVTEGMKVNEGEVYVSPIDLNIENNKVCWPPIPMVRFCTPIVDTKGNKQGLIVLNYHGKNLKLLQPRSFDDPERVYLVNQQGYWLRGPNPSKEWGFMFEHGRNIVFQNDFPGAWEPIRNQEFGQFEHGDGYLTFTTVHPIYTLSPQTKGTTQPSNTAELDHSLKIIAHLQADKLDYIRSDVFWTLFPGYVGILAILSVGALLLAKSRQRRVEYENMLKLTNQLLAMEKDKMKELASRDELTGLLSRRFFLEHLDKLTSGVRRYNTSLCVLLVDLDHFKQVNDTFGHLLGDAVLRSTGEVIRNEIRDADYAGRYGGEELCIALPGTNLHGAKEMAERLRQSVAAQVFRDKNENVFRVTCSIGVAQCDPTVDQPKTLLNMADEALYSAKENGRNQVVCSGLHVDKMLTGAYGA